MVTKIVDGDTVGLSVDLGFGISYRGSFRLLGCNAIELSQPGGKEARDNLTQLLPPGTAVTLHSVKDDKDGGRFLAQIYRSGADIPTILINTGWAAAWDGIGKAPTPTWPRNQV